MDNLDSIFSQQIQTLLIIFLVKESKLYTILILQKLIY